MHQQQLAMLAQQQSLLMAAAAKSGVVDQNFLAVFNRLGPTVLTCLLKIGQTLAIKFLDWPCL